MKRKNKIIIASGVISLIIFIGIIVVCKWGFNKELRFEQSQRIDIYIEQEVDREKIKEIADEVLGMHNMVQTIEIYQDMVTIRAKDISEEQKNSIMEKVKAVYEIEQTSETTDINVVPGTRIRDMYKQYIIPFIVSVVLVTAYMMIRYNKKGILKVCIRTVLIPFIVEMLFLSWVAIVRIPLGRFIPTYVILLYIISIIYVIRKNEE